MRDKSKDQDRNPITEFVSIFVSDPEINEKADKMFDRELHLSSLSDLFDNNDNNDNNDI